MDFLLQILQQQYEVSHPPGDVNQANKWKWIGLSALSSQDKGGEIFK